MDVKRFCYRVLFYVLGLFVMAIGVTFASNSNLGMSPVNSIPAVLSAITNLEMGTCVIVVFSLFILAQILIQRRDFRWINLTQLIFSTIFGLFVDFTAFLFQGFCLPTIFGRLAMMVISLFFIAAGVSTYVATNLINMPMEGMTLAITEKIPRKTFRQVKIVVDTTTVLIALALSLLLMSRIQTNLGIQGYPTSLVFLGTVVSAVFVGVVMGPIQKRVVPPIRRICFGETASAEANESCICLVEK